MELSFDQPFVSRLSDPTLVLRRQMLVTGLFKHVGEIQELEDGYAFKFRYSDLLIRRMADYILFESRNSPKLTFMIIVESNCNASWLHVRGPWNAKDQIRNEWVSGQCVVPLRTGGP